MRRNIAFGIGCVFVAAILVVLPDRAPRATAQDPAVIQPEIVRADVNAQVLAFIQPVAPSDADDELTRKLKERHNAATDLLQGRVEEYKRGISGLEQVLEAAKLVAEAKYDMAADNTARLTVLRETLEIAKLIEARQKTQYDAGIGSQSDFHRARLARLTVEVQILKLKQGVANN